VRHAPPRLPRLRRRRAHPARLRDHDGADPLPRRLPAAGHGLARPRDPHRRRPQALSRLGLRRPRRAARRQKPGPQLRPWRRRHNALLGLVEARRRSRPARPSGAGRGDRGGGDGIDDGPAHSGGGLPGHHLRQGAAARHHLQHRRRAISPVRPLPSERGHSGMARAIPRRGGLQLAPLPDHGRRRLRDTLAAHLRKAPSASYCPPSRPATAC
jgi:hypothetical protein